MHKARRHRSSELYFIDIHDCKTSRHGSLEGATGPHLNVSEKMFHFCPRHLLTRNSGAKSGSLKEKQGLKEPLFRTSSSKFEAPCGAKSGLK